MRYQLTLWRRFLIFSGSLLFFVSINLGAQTEHILEISSPDDSEQFGWSVSVSGDRAAVGAIGEETSKGASGAVFIYEKSGSLWNQTAVLEPADGHNNMLFGFAVDLDGDRLIVGAPHKNVNGNTQYGGVYIYRKIGSSWTLEGQPGPANDASWSGSLKFGFDVGIDGTTALAGTGTSVDAAWVIDDNGSGWQLTTQLNSDNSETSFGSSLALNDGAAIIGAYQDDDLAAFAGSAYIFRESGSSWSQEAKLFANDGAILDWFGRGVDINGSRVVIGAPWDDDDGSKSGSAYVFEKVFGIWMQLAKLTADDANANDDFGWSVAVEGNIVAVGARRKEGTTAADNGAAYRFEKTGSTWGQTHKFSTSAGDETVIGHFGSSVDTDSDQFIAGMPFYDGKDYLIGRAYLYDFASSSFSKNADEGVDAALTFDLKQNYPNPFNPSTKIAFTVAKAGNVNLTVYDVTGRAVANLVGSHHEPGSYEVTFNASELGSGMYFYQLTQGGAKEIRRMMLVR